MKQWYDYYRFCVNGRVNLQMLQKTGIP